MTASKMSRFGAMIVLLAVSAAPGAAPNSSLTLVTAAEPGQRLTISGRVVDSSGQPVSGAELHVYQTDTSGRYTPERPMDEPHARLSGWLRTDAQGRFELRTIRPGGYPKALRIEGRDRKIPAHIHIDVTAAGYASRKLQAVFADDPLLSDPYWKEWVDELHQPVLVVSSAGSTQTAKLQISLRR